MDRKLLRKISSSADELNELFCKDGGHPYVGYVYDLDRILYNKGSWIRLWLGSEEEEESEGITLSVFTGTHVIRDLIDVVYHNDIDTKVTYSYVGEVDGRLKYSSIYSNDFVYIPADSMIGEPDKDNWTVSADVYSVICRYDADNGAYEALSGKDYFVSGVRLKSFTEVTEDVSVDESMNGKRIYCVGIGSSISSSCLRSLELKNIDLFDGFRFASNSNLTSVKMLGKCVYLPVNTFAFCPMLTDVHLPIDLETVGDSCFEQCSSLSSIDIPFSVTSIGENCFYDCPSLTSISYNGNISSLPAGAPWGAENCTVIHCKDGDYVATVTTQEEI